MSGDRRTSLAEQAALFWPFACAAATIGVCVLLRGRMAGTPYSQGEAAVVWLTALVAVVGATAGRLWATRGRGRTAAAVAFAALAFLMYAGPVAVYQVFTTGDR